MVRLHTWTPPTDAEYVTVPVTGEADDAEAEVRVQGLAQAAGSLVEVPPVERVGTMSIETGCPDPFV
jgi:hypothetical protein